MAYLYPVILDLYLYLVINSSAAGGDHWWHPVSPLLIVLALVFASHICVLHFHLHHIFVCMLYVVPGTEP